MEVKHERTGWRDEGLSKRHRLWGYDCPALDIDFLLVEFDTCKPKALVEYKNIHAPDQTANMPQYRTLVNLGNMAKIPVFSVRYSDDYSKYTVTALNDLAANTVPDGKYFPPRVRMSEVEYVSFLYKLRGRVIPDEIKNKLQEDITL